jgi:superfamily I DNA and RNA helicase
MSMHDGGREPVVREAEAGGATVDAVRKELHRLIVDEGVRPWDIVVLSGRTASKSDVWRHRRFGNVELWNGAFDADGNSLALPADEVPDEPSDAGVVRFETVRRFKGLERPVVILCELDPAVERFDQLMYTALTRATVQLVLVVIPELARQLHTMRSSAPVTVRGGVA